MNPVALLGAVFGGAAGALVWCLVAYFTGYDLPPAAMLAVGGIVGFAAVSLDGRGVSMAFCCSLICLVSIFCAKVGSVHLAMAAARDDLAAKLTEERYEAMLDQAPRLGMLPSSEYYKDFMVDNGYVEEQTVTDEDVERFNAVEVPVLRRLLAEKVDIETWRRLYAERYLQHTVSHHSAVRIVVSEFGLAELFFASLSVAITFGMVINATEATRRQAPQITRVE